MAHRSAASFARLGHGSGAMEPLSGSDFPDFPLHHTASSAPRHDDELLFALDPPMHSGGDDMGVNLDDVDGMELDAVPETAALNSPSTTSVASASASLSAADALLVREAQATLIAIDRLVELTAALRPELLADSSAEQAADVLLARHHAQHFLLRYTQALGLILDASTQSQPMALPTVLSAFAQGNTPVYSAPSPQSFAPTPINTNPPLQFVQELGRSGGQRVRGVSAGHGEGHFKVESADSALMRHSTGALPSHHQQGREGASHRSQSYSASQGLSHRGPESAETFTTIDLSAVADTPPDFAVDAPRKASASGRVKRREPKERSDVHVDAHSDAQKDALKHRSPRERDERGSGGSRKREREHHVGEQSFRLQPSPQAHVGSHVGSPTGSAMTGVTSTGGAQGFVSMFSVHGRDRRTRPAASTSLSSSPSSPALALSATSLPSPSPTSHLAASSSSPSSPLYTPSSVYTPYTPSPFPASPAYPQTPAYMPPPSPSYRR